MGEKKAQNGGSTGENLKQAKFRIYNPGCEQAQTTGHVR
jgi:hypothetical protein